MKIESKLSAAFGAILVVAIIFLATATGVILLTADAVSWVVPLIIGGVGILLLAVITIMWGKLKNDIAIPLQELAAYADKLAKGDANSNLTIRAEGELAEIATNLNKTYADMAELKKFMEELLKQADFDNGGAEIPKGLGRTLTQTCETASKLAQAYKAEISEVTFIIEKLAIGEINTNTRARSQKNLAKATDALAKSLSQLENDTFAIMQGIADGNMLATADADKFTGSFQKIIKSANIARSTVLDNAKQLEAGLNELANGVFTQRIKPEAKGELAKCITAYNNAISSLEKAVANINADILSATTGGRMRGGYLGDFAKLQKSLDGLLTAVVAPKPTPAASRIIPRTTGASRSDTGDTNRMSGAKKITDPGKSYANAEFMRPDFGKY